MDITPCHYRYIRQGRTFCHLAIDERKYTTTEVAPSACLSCRVPGILEAHACRHMSFGVEVDEYGGRLTAETCHTSCEKLVVRLFTFGECGEGVCEHWEPWDAEGAIEKARAAAEEARQGRKAEETGFGDLSRD